MTAEQIQELWTVQGFVGQGRSKGEPHPAEKAYPPTGGVCGPALVVTAWEFLNIMLLFQVVLVLHTRSSCSRP